jgi:drug/metabolite transporter (DMT)-like permease
MKIRIWTALIAIYAIWGSTYLAIRFAVQTIPPFLMAGTRFLVAGTILYTWRRLAGDPAPTRKQWQSAAIIGLLLLLGGNGVVSWAEQKVVSGVAALMVGSIPLWVVLIEAVWPGRPKPSWKILIGVFIGFLGIAVLIGPDELVGGNHTIDPIGAGALLLAACLWAIGSIYTSEATLPASPLLGTSMEMLGGAGGLLLVGTLTGEWGRLNLNGISLNSVTGLVYLIVFGSLIGFASFSWLLRVAPISLVSTYAYVNPLVAVILGNLIAQEPLNFRIMLSAVVIVGSVILINTTRYAPRETPSPVFDPVSPGDD